MSTDDPLDLKSTIEDAAKSARVSTYDYILMKGNQVEALTRKLLEYEEGDRCYWFSAGYADKLDITLVMIDLSKTVHKLKLYELLDGQEYQVLDWDTIDSTNSDDIHFVDEALGLI